MDTDPDYTLEELDRALAAEPDRASLYLQRGRLHHRAGRFTEAFNDFVRVLQLDPDNNEAPEYLALLREIFAFRDPDMYNP